MKHTNRYILLMLALLPTFAAFAANIGDIVKLSATNTTGASTVQIPITLHVTGTSTVAIGNGYNACISEYTDGAITLPSIVTIDGKAYTVTAIADYAFQFCNGITRVELPRTVVSVGEYAFNACTKLSEVTLPSTLETIGDGAFYNCTALSMVKANMRQPQSTFGFNNIFQNLTPKKTLKIPAGKKKCYLADVNGYDNVNLWEKYFNISSDPQTFTDNASGIPTEFDILEDGTVKLLKASNTSNIAYATYTNAHYTDTGNHIDEYYDIASIAPGAFSNNDQLLYVDFTNAQPTLDNTSRTFSSSPLYGMSAYTLVYLPKGNTVTGENIVNTEDGSTYTCASLRLSGDRTFDIPHPFHADAATLERNFTSGRISTLFAPFPFQSGDAGTYFKLTNYDNATGTLHFQSVDATESNQAYLFRPSTTTNTLTASNIDVAMPNGMYTPSSILSTDNAMNATFYGVYSRIDVPQGAYGYLASDYNQDGESYAAGTFVRAGSNVSMRPYRAFLWLGDSESQAKQVVFDDPITDIDKPITISPSAEIFNISGQRVKTPSHGIYIMNGKKILVK